MKVKITLVGCGNMGSALLESWLRSFPDFEFGVVEPNALPRDIENKVIHVGKAADMSNFLEDSDIVILAVKPQIMSDVCLDLKPFIDKEALILSIAAGQSLANFEGYFSDWQPVIRCMPNTPAAIGKGATVAVANENVSFEQKSITKNLLSNAGLFEWVEDEALLNAVTAVSGSGPAYVFHLIEMLEAAAIETGLSPDLSAKLARQTIIGAAALAEDQEKTPASTLRENVTSPGGTTAAALETLMNGELQDIYIKAILDAKKRSEELN